MKKAWSCQECGHTWYTDDAATEAKCPECGERHREIKREFLFNLCFSPPEGCYHGTAKAKETK